MIDLPDNRQIIDNKTTAEDIFIDHGLFHENGIEYDNMQIIDNILKVVNHSEILMQYTLPEKDIKIEQKAPETLNFKDVLLPKRKKKKSSLLSASQAISKKYRKIRQKKNDKLKFIKRVPIHSRDRLTHKVKSMTSVKDVKFIKQVSSYPRDKLKRLTRDTYDNNSTINYDDDVNIDDLSDAETVNYKDNIVKPKKTRRNYRRKKFKKIYKNVKWKINEKNNKLAQKTRQKEDDIVFIKQDPCILVKKLSKDDEVVFVNQVPMHPQS